ncbi:diguanylate cyclase [Thiorhodococcus mannitoliphagus]|uniref:Diguanylate cyclase n=1 Tax=Thiorhodococcus mannitoliphagus TaxID=329406 RepID=A0A6P1DUL0_9GAMM|nr:sensor domain-containing diguanylate cyclase [Thiorhodococcus mannitoliphagus]NEX19732.1 diguanylate cyclase [Thiorhodococcus mannitoliphagus]
MAICESSERSSGPRPTRAQRRNRATGTTTPPPDVADAPADLSARIRAERVGLVYGNTRPALFANLLTALLALVIVFPEAPVIASGTWLTGMLIISAVRWWMKLARDREAKTVQTPPAVWARRLTILVIINGLWWGAIGVLLLLYAAPVKAGFATFILGGMIAGAVATLGPLRSAYLGFTIPMAGSLAGILLWQNEPDAAVMSALVIAFELAMIGTALHVSKIVSRNIELRLHNETLVQSLTAANLSLKHEVEERKRAEKRSDFLATHDLLTGLPNRRVQKDRFDHAIARTSHQDGRAAIFFIDLDRFKAINDTLGHPAGDVLLRTLADRLRGSLRPGDSVCRHGGDEFLLLLADAADHTRVSSVAERIIQSLSNPVEINGECVEIGCSIGISLCPDDGDDFELLIQRADKALYRAKRDGRGNYRFFAQELDEQEPRTLSAEQAS